MRNVEAYVAVKLFPGPYLLEGTVRKGKVFRNIVVWIGGPLPVARHPFETLQSVFSLPVPTHPFASTPSLPFPMHATNALKLLAPPTSPPSPPTPTPPLLPLLPQPPPSQPPTQSPRTPVLSYSLPLHSDAQNLLTGLRLGLKLDSESKKTGQSCESSDQKVTINESYSEDVNGHQKKLDDGSSTSSKQRKKRNKKKPKSEISGGLKEIKEVIKHDNIKEGIVRGDPIMLPVTMLTEQRSKKRCEPKMFDNYCECNKVCVKFQFKSDRSKFRYCSVKLCILSDPSVFISRYKVDWDLQLREITATDDPADQPECDLLFEKYLKKQP